MILSNALEGKSQDEQFLVNFLQRPNEITMKFTPQTQNDRPGLTGCMFFMLLLDITQYMALKKGHFNGGTGTL